MGEAVRARLARFIAELAEFPLEQDEFELISRIVLHRLETTGAMKKPVALSLNKLAHDVFRVSRMRNEVLGHSCCPDPQWNMLLDLVVAYTESRPVDVTGMTLASGIAPTTALAHIGRMETAGLLRRKPSRSDQRRTWIEPTPHALSATETLLRKIYDAGR